MINYIDTRQLWIGSEVVNFSAKYGLFPYFDVDEYEFSVSTFEDYVKACALYSGIEWETLSSSAGSLDESSSSVEIDWDYYSSSEGSSSSEVELSSSFEIQTSLSEEILSSSSDVFVAGEDQVYTPDQIFRSGLQNMEPGACYSTNPDRGTIYGWNISYNASDSWWWRKVDCETGEEPIESGIGACSAYPESVPSNVSGCYSYNGSCYICDKSKGDYVDCNADWLWKYNFPTHDWFKQVDCYNPYEEEEDDVQCPDGNALLKRTADNGDYEVEGDGLAAEFLNQQKYYDVMGRLAKITLTRQRLYKDYRNSKQGPQSLKNQLQKSIEKSFERMNQGGTSRALFKRDDCGIERGDYGIVENDGSETGGITCPDFRTYYGQPKVVGNYVFGEECEVNGCRSKIVKFKVGTTLMMKKHSIDYYVVEVGFTFSDGHVTTMTEHDALVKHEKGHVDDAECIAQKFISEGKYIEVEIEACNEQSSLDMAIKEKMTPYENELRKNTDLRVDKATARYHQKYKTYDYPKEKYVCPSDL